MPRWLIDIFIVILAGAAVFFCGWLRERLRLNGWHLGAILLVGILVFVVGSFWVVLPMIYLGSVVLGFTIFAWGYELMILLTARWASKRSK
jgi:hypothetical protein